MRLWCTSSRASVISLVPCVWEGREAEKKRGKGKGEMREGRVVKHTEILHAGPSMSPWPMSIRGIRIDEACCAMVGDVCGMEGVRGGRVVGGCSF